MAGLTRTVGNTVSSYTFSFWFKNVLRGDAYNNLFQQLFSVYRGTTRIGTLALDSISELRIYRSPNFRSFRNNGETSNVNTNMKFLDHNKWYHMVVTQNDDDQLFIYVNGHAIAGPNLTWRTTRNDNDLYYRTNSAEVKNITDGRNNNISPRSYAGLPWFIDGIQSGDTIVIGSDLDNNPANRFYGVMSKFEFIDGRVLEPTDFGSFDTATGHWVPKATQYSLQSSDWGTEGFYLPFTNVSNHGVDSSGNSNNFTEISGSELFHSNDSPTNNLSNVNIVTRDLNDNSSGVRDGDVVAADNLQYGGFRYVGTRMIRMSRLMNKGKWYFEFLCRSSTNNSQGGYSVGLVPYWYFIGEDDFWGNTRAPYQYVWRNDGNTYRTWWFNDVTDTFHTHLPADPNAYTDDNDYTWSDIGRYNSRFSASSESGNTIPDAYLNGGNFDSGFTKTYGTGDYIQVAVDLDNLKIWWGKNGTWGNGNPSNNTDGESIINPNEFDTRNIYDGFRPTTRLLNNYGLLNEETPRDYHSNETSYGRERYAMQQINQNYYVMALDAWANTVTMDINSGNGYFGIDRVTNPYRDADGFGEFRYEVPTGFYTLNNINYENYGDETNQFTWGETIPV